MLGAIAGAPAAKAAAAEAETAPAAAAPAGAAPAPAPAAPAAAPPSRGEPARVGAGAAALAAAGPRAGGAEHPRKVEVSGVGVGRPRTGRLHYTAPSETGGVDERDEGSPASGATLTDTQMSGTPRNAPCPCGSGKKFKMCHGRR
ncbi:SEC-C metal-binding domain-containing protein [Fodinibacter luteus]